MNKVQDAAGTTMALGNLTLTGISGAAATFSSAATDFAINGKAYTLPTKASVAFPATDVNTGLAPVGLTVANTGTVMVVGSNAALTVQAAQGSVEILDAGGNFIKPPSFPSLPDNFCPLAYIVIKAGPTLAAAFIPGTGNWNQTGVTESVDNIATLPDHPAVS